MVFLWCVCLGGGVRGCEWRAVGDVGALEEFAPLFPSVVHATPPSSPLCATPLPHISPPICHSPPYLPHHLPSLPTSPAHSLNLSPPCTPPLSHHLPPPPVLPPPLSNAGWSAYGPVWLSHHLCQLVNPNGAHHRRGPPHHSTPLHTVGGGLGGAAARHAGSNGSTGGGAALRPAAVPQAKPWGFYTLRLPGP